jgi:hypothetical protein
MVEQVSTTTPVAPKPKPKKVRVWGEGDRIVLGVRPRSSNWYDITLSRDEMVQLVSDLVKAALR